MENWKKPIISSIIFAVTVGLLQFVSSASVSESIKLTITATPIYFSVVVLFGMLKKYKDQD